MKKKPKKITLKEILPKYTLDDIIEIEADEEAMTVADAEIDRHLNVLQEYIGRELINIERRAVFDIVEEFSAKDEDGYITLYFSFRRGRFTSNAGCGSNRSAVYHPL